MSPRRPQRPSAGRSTSSTESSTGLSEGSSTGPSTGGGVLNAGPSPDRFDGLRSAHVAAARRLRRAAARREEGLFLVEGAQAVTAALHADALVELFIGESALARHAQLTAGTGVPVRFVTDAAAAALSETVTPQGLVGVSELPGHRLADLGRPRLVAVCEGANDPGNAGTVIRSADAAGADAVVFVGDSVDPFGGKCVRSSAGSLFHLPVIVAADALAVVRELRELGCQVLATSGHADRDLDDLAAAGVLAGPTAWVFGNEARGLTAATAASADTAVRVPVYGQAESLNLAVASALCMYASARAQRAVRSATSGASGGGAR
ncbi:RNA methyltransferase [Parafrankia sp. EUN1f]|uniref:TrmH family RNA methyltransferase n=1 Tax=Parafrankia sp. EUN1f TaxID=102897 RepID=UPI0001C43E9B|nr:RNA methyltransferase [Parafrankia sp. EUN1f]EFC84637.1 tRNA/rRNA methyltransferase (SpoU) [Parafrankia sp. EUN1f]